MKTPIIDVHLHCSELEDDALLSYARLNGLDYKLSELLRLMVENGVERGLLLSPPLKNKRPAPNDLIIELCEESEDKLFPVLTVEPERDLVRAAIDLASRYVGYVKAFKIRLGYVKIFAEDPVFDPLYDYAQDQKLPVLFHTGDTATSDGSLVHSHPLTLDALANRRQDLTIVICHFGNPWILDVGELIYKHTNVYTDLSGLIAGEGSVYAEKYSDALAAKISEAIYFAGGAEKIFFGTDYPVETFSSGLGLAKKLAIEEEDLQNILWKNADRVFFP